MLTANGIGCHGGHQSGVDAARQSQAHSVETVLHHVVLETEHAGRVHFAVRIHLGCDVGRLLGGRSGIDVDVAQVITNIGERSSNVPSASTTKVPPSNTRSSWPPTWLT